MEALGLYCRVMAQKSFIAGCESLVLSREEKAFFRAEKPWGFILFARNCHDGDQIRALCAALRAAAEDDAAPIFIDQEGGRVRRLKPPLVPDYPAGSAYGALYRKDAESGLRAAWLGARLIAHDLAGFGITGNCLPIVDVRQPYGDAIIGDRAYGERPEDVAAVGRAIADGAIAGGVLPVMKHVPGHGRARLDSHKALPVLEDSIDDLRAVDFLPFKRLNTLPLAMTAHIVYGALDRSQPATTSPVVIEATIRGEIGFDGALMSDDLSMQALSGTIGERTRAALEAGCDLALHCNGDLSEMQAVAAVADELAGEAKRRADAARASRRPAEFCDIKGLRDEFDTLLSMLPAA